MKTNPTTTTSTTDPARPGVATPYSLVMTTIDSQDAAEHLAAEIVEARLAACVQIVPVRSVYRWHGELRREPECLLLIKTAAPLPDIERLLRARHSYQTPEIVQLPISGGSNDYLSWLAEAGRG